MLHQSPTNMRRAGGAYILPSKSSAQLLLHDTIFPSAESVHHTSMGMRFLRTPIADCRIGQGTPNRHAPVTTVRSANDADDNRTAL
jgi:hypothetical protein